MFVAFTVNLSRAGLLLIQKAVCYAKTEGTLCEDLIYMLMYYYCCLVYFSEGLVCISVLPPCLGLPSFENYGARALFEN